MSTKSQDIYSILSNIQAQIAVPKNQYNKFGGYYYRSIEDILNVTKPILKQYDATLLLDDEIVQVGDRIYLKATAKLCYNNEILTCSSYAREASEKKGMDSAQVTGSCSSYARKYALDGLFAIADTADPDTLNTHNKNGQESHNSNSQPVQQKQDNNTTQGTGEQQKTQNNGTQLITQKQLGLLNQQLQLLTTDKTEMKSICNNWLTNNNYGTIESTKELTKNTATKLIDAIKGQVNEQAEQHDPLNGNSKNMDDLPFENKEDENATN